MGNLSSRDYIALAAGREVRLPRRQMNLRRDRQISNATTMLLSNQMWLLDFLHLGAFIFDPPQVVGENVRIFIIFFRVCGVFESLF